MKTYMLIILTINFAILTIAFIFGTHKSYNKSYNNGWNDAIDTIPKLIIFNAPIEVWNLDKNKLPQDEEGRPAFICRKPAISYKFNQGGDTMSIAQILPSKR